MQRPLTTPAGLPILLYHRLGKPHRRSLVKGHHVSPSLFRAQLRWLLAHGYRMVGLSEVLDFVRGSARPARAAALTFDDGYASLHEHALPVLRDLKVTAAIFLVAGFVGRCNEWDQAAGDVPERMLDEAQIAELRAAGVAFGSHAMTHAHLTTLSEQQAWAEVYDSKQVLEDMLQAPVEFFAYPYGEGDERIRDMVMRAGYKAACATTPRVCRPGDDPFRLPRINIRRYNYLPMFARKLRRAYRAP